MCTVFPREQRTAQSNTKTARVLQYAESRVWKETTSAWRVSRTASPDSHIGMTIPWCTHGQRGSRHYISIPVFYFSKLATHRINEHLTQVYSTIEGAPPPLLTIVLLAHGNLGETYVPLCHERYTHIPCWGLSVFELEGPAIENLWFGKCQSEGMACLLGVHVMFAFLERRQTVTGYPGSAWQSHSGQKLYMEEPLPVL